MVTNEEIDEEIIADQFEDVAKRSGLLQSIAGKNRGLVERVVQCLKDTMNKFIDHFRNPSGKLTINQSIALADEFGKIAKDLVDPNGQKIFRHNNRTKNIELADGRSLDSINHKKPQQVKIEQSVSFNTMREARQIVRDKLSPLKGTPITNKNTGIEAKIASAGIKEFVKNSAIDKSLVHGYSVQQHIEAALNIKKLYENAELTETRPGTKLTDDPSTLRSIKRFNYRANIIGQEAETKITVKESFQHGHRVYSIELEELNKPAELKNRTGTDSSAGSESSTQKGNMSSSRYAEEPSEENIPQGEDKIKYSIGNSDNEHGWLKGLAKKLGKALHLNGDKIIIEEDRRKAHLQEQEKTMADYLKDPSKDNKYRLNKLGVTKGQLQAYMNGEEYLTGIGLIQNYRSSPSRIADKIAVFRAFFRMGDRAMDKLVKLRDSFSRKYDSAIDLVKSKEEREKLIEILWDGDEEQKVFTKEELLQDGVSENVADAYIAIRRQMNRAYTLLDEARRRSQNYAKYLSDKQYEKLHDNKFVKQDTLKIHDTQDENGRHLVTWTEYGNSERDYIIDGSARGRFLMNDAIQILDEQQLEDGTYKVTVREGIPALGTVGKLGQKKISYIRYSVEPNKISI